MGAKNLSFRDLQCIVAIAECGSFSKAAVSCAITQPALSERIKRIETLLDTELFERTKRTINLTPAGEAMSQKAVALLDGVSELDNILASTKEPLVGSLRVGLINTLGPYLLPHVLSPLRQTYPRLEINLQEALTETLLANLQAGSIDLIIAAAPIEASWLEQTPLFFEPFRLAISKHHPFANSDNVIAADLIGEDMILLEDGHCLSGQALDVCPAKKRSNLHRLHSTSLETLRHMVAAGTKYTLLPELAVGKKPLLSDLIEYKQLGDKHSYGRTIVLGWRKTFGRKEEIALFADLIRNSLPESVQKISG